MEKFTVDIDKVLDDFEFNEDRATEIATTSCNNQSNHPNNFPISYESETPVNHYLNNSPHYHYNNSYLPPAYEIKSDELYHGDIETPKLYNNLDDNYLNKNPAKKNSVSNVFNSLQEYINTDVSTEQQPSKQNNIENDGADQLKQNNLAAYGISNIEHQYTLLHKETNKLYEEGEVKLLPKIENNQQEPKVDNIYMSNQVQNNTNLKPIDEQLNADNEGVIINSDCNNINELSDELLPKVDNQLMEQDLENDKLTVETGANLVEIDTPTDNLQSEYITEIENPQELQSLNINYESQQVTNNLEIISELETKVESVEKVDIEEVEINSKIPELIQVSCSQNENVVSFDNIEVDDVTENDLDQYLQDVNNEIAQLDLQDGEIKANSETSLPMQEESHEEVTIIEEKEQISELTEEISHHASEEINKSCTIPKLSTLCRPNSLDIVSNNSDNEPGPPGETPMPKEPKETDFSPSTSEVSSVENQEYVSNSENELNERIVPEEIEDTADVSEYVNHSPLGKRPPYWIPDTDTNLCMHCGFKFTVIRRRHHCRACGLVSSYLA